MAEFQEEGHVAVFQDEGHKDANECQSLRETSRRDQNAQLMRGMEAKLTAQDSLGPSSGARKEMDSDDKHQKLGFYMWSQAPRGPFWFSVAEGSSQARGGRVLKRGSTVLFILLKVLGHFSVCILSILKVT